MVISVSSYKQQPAHTILVPAHSEQMSILLASDVIAPAVMVPAFSASKSDCDKEDEEDCKSFCEAAEQTSTCAARGDKITCYCKGGKSESNCEERCLLCMSGALFHLIVRLTRATGMPDKSTLNEATRLFKLGGSRMDEL